MDYAVARRAMVDSQLRPQAVSDPLVIAAMAVVPREAFFPAELRASAYVDRIVPIAGGRGFSPPASLGRLLTVLAPRPGERALVVGAGSGYGVAVLAHMGVQVTALEADANLLALRPTPGDARWVEGELAAGAPGAEPFDLIVIEGQIEELPAALIDQLKVGGRLGTALLADGVTRLMSGTRSTSGFGLKSIVDAAMAPLPGFSRPPVFTF